MDSFQSFGLCENALEFQVEVELPDNTLKTYVFHSRFTVDKIKSTILLDQPTLKKHIPSDYIILVDGEKIEIDFQRFIVSHPRITEILEQEPRVRIKLISKQQLLNRQFSPPLSPNTSFINNNSNSNGNSNNNNSNNNNSNNNSNNNNSNGNNSNNSSGNINKLQDQLNLNVKVSDLKLTLEKSPNITRISGGGRQRSPDPSGASTSSTSLLSFSSLTLHRPKKEDSSNKLPLPDFKNVNSSGSKTLRGEKSLDKLSKLGKSFDSGILPPTTSSTTSSSTTTTTTETTTTTTTTDTTTTTTSTTTPTSPTSPSVGGFFSFGSPKIKSFFVNTFDQKRRSLSATNNKQRSVEDLSYSSIHIGATTLRPKTQEFQNLLKVTTSNGEMGVGSLIPIPPSGTGGSGTGSNSGSSNSSSGRSSMEMISSISDNGSIGSGSSTCGPSSSVIWIKDHSLIQLSKGFSIEPQRASLTLPLIKSSGQLELNSLITNESWYCKYFYGQDHWNYIGEDSKTGIFIVSILKENDPSTSTSTTPSLTPISSPSVSSTNLISDQQQQQCNISNIDTITNGSGSKKYNFIVLLRTKNSDIFTKARIKGTFLGGLSTKPPVKEIVQSIIPDISFKFLKSVKGAEIQKDLQQFEERQRVKSFKFGILYCAPNQCQEEEMFSNANGSDGFNQFLDFIGQRINLNGWKDYRGGLDVKLDSTGTQSIYEKYNGFEIMFHVAPLLPYNILDKQQVDKKRHLGNDIVLIIYKEGNQLFDPKVMKSDFNHVFIVISPIDNTTTSTVKKYKVSIVYKDGVESSTPYLTHNSIWEESPEFKEFLLCKLINSECSSYEAPSFKIKIQRTRVALLKDMNTNYLLN